jgi:hypothetical protein
MKNKLKIIAYSAIPLVGLAMLSANIASAHGFDGFGGGLGRWSGAGGNSAEFATNLQNKFQNEANLLGISVDEVKTGWAQGKTLEQIAAEHNITTEQLQQKFKDQRLTNMKTNLQSLVSAGIITQAQADSRLSFMQSNIDKGFSGKSGKGMRGMHLGL